MGFGVSLILVAIGAILTGQATTVAGVYGAAPPGGIISERGNPA